MLYSGHALQRTPLCSGHNLVEPNECFILKFTSLQRAPLQENQWCPPQKDSNVVCMYQSKQTLRGEVASFEVRARSRRFQQDSPSIAYPSLFNEYLSNQKNRRRQYLRIVSTIEILDLNFRTFILYRRRCLILFKVNRVKYQKEIHCDCFQEFSANSIQWNLSIADTIWSQKRCPLQRGARYIEV